MTEKPFSLDTIENLKEQLDSLLRKIDSEEKDTLSSSLQAVQASHEIILELRQRIKGHHFDSDASEIYYFKVYFPSIYQHYIYHVELAKLYLQLPPIVQQQPAYWQEALDDITLSFQDQRELLHYTRSQATHLDYYYFKRHSTTPLPPMDDISLPLDNTITTATSYRISRLMALERLAAHIEARINNPCENSSVNTHPSFLQWTGSKVSLIELIYGLQLAGVFNHANVDIKSLVHSFEQLFQVKLGNVYNAFQEMRLRKKNRSPFFDQLKERLVQKMDELDER